MPELEPYDRDREPIGRWMRRQVKAYEAWRDADLDPLLFASIESITDGIDAARDELRRLNGED